MYRITHECRMCGDVFLTSNLSKKQVDQFLKNKEFPDNIYHICDNGSVGVCEFGGFTKVMEDYKL